MLIIIGIIVLGLICLCGYREKYHLQIYLQDWFVLQLLNNIDNVMIISCKPSINLLIVFIVSRWFFSLRMLLDIHYFSFSYGCNLNVTLIYTIYCQYSRTTYFIPFMINSLDSNLFKCLSFYIICWFICDNCGIFFICRIY